jgi:hypothetical protein
MTNHAKIKVVIKTKTDMAKMNLKVRLIRERKKDLNGFIDAVRFLRHVIS